MKLIASLTFSLICLTVLGQNRETQIKPINTIEQAEDFIQVHTDLESEIWTVTPEIESNEMGKLFTGKKTGDIFSDKENTYKIIESKSKKAFRVSYIYLDGSTISLEAINKIRKNILEKYKNGVPFADLANEYTMDSSTDGDLGWFTEGMMMKEFETAIKKHELNDIFTVDIPSKKWYYVTLKTFPEKKVEELTILKVKHSN